MDTHLPRLPHPVEVHLHHPLTALPKREDYRPIARSFHHAWNFRSQWVYKNCWFLLTAEVCDTLAQFLQGRHVLEVFAGSGYLGHHLRTTGKLASYRGYDLRRYRFKGTARKNAFMAPIKKADVILMTWPEYDTNDAYRIVRKMVPGQILIYQGEGYGGCTGDDTFHEYLHDHFTYLNEISDRLDEGHLRFNGINDQWHVYRR